MVVKTTDPILHNCAMRPNGVSKDLPPFLTNQIGCPMNSQNEGNASPCFVSNSMGWDGMAWDGMACDGMGWDDGERGSQRNSERVSGCQLYQLGRATGPCHPTSRGELWKKIDGPGLNHQGSQEPPSMTKPKRTCDGSYLQT